MNNSKSAESCCSTGNDKTVLLYSCSGAANVAEIADRAARDLMFDGQGSMFWLAGLGAGIQEMIQSARDAYLNVVIDGCPLECAKKIFENCDISNYVQTKVTDLGIEKLKGVRAKDEDIGKVVTKVKEVLKNQLSGENV